ncbi:lysylphosphatidylglycerol synthase transmembrane domain-containing protein [uncultured Maribacter sp.]|uniref:lysylphosphatidylglycerol synthase transmembrane domain-containing protein n=1 Tax=uncultured Maribacter sp. TaxID=431308 RepID=UPI0026275DBF|nr:lysylphosphatidylglycerol synthase transmembrane domain-containing protein [uncultured Maribacter sp.]
MTKPPKHITTALKVIISAILIYFIFTKIDINEIGAVLKKAKAFYIVLAVLLFVFSKAIASVRLNLYFHQLKVHLTEKSNLQLYLLGMFYNLFLPGGIGGDAYKGYVIKKQFKVDTKKIVSVLVIDRLSGLLLLFIFACALSVIIDIEWLQNLKILIITTLFASVLVFWFLIKKFFNYILSVFWTSFIFSALVQLAQLGSIFLVLMSLGIETDLIGYLLIFLISSIVSVIPLTIGGIGSREITFFYGATLLGLNETVSLSISMLFFLITASVSFFGILYHFKKPELKEISFTSRVGND